MKHSDYMEILWNSQGILYMNYITARELRPS